MNVSKVASLKLLDEFKKSKVVVTFSDQYYHGYPVIDFMNCTYTIEKVEPINGLILKEFTPFSISINNEFKSPIEFPFSADPKYKLHIADLRNDVIAEIDKNINLRLGKWDILDYLSNLEFELREIKNNINIIEDEIINKEGINKIECHIESDNLPIFRNNNIEIEAIGIEHPSFGIYYEYSLSRYWDIQISEIEKLLRIIDSRKIIIEKTDNYVKEINALSSQYILQWTKTDTDLLELIIALYEVGAIQNITKDLTQKEAIQTFSVFFDKEIKDQYKKLNAARYRKKEDPGFIIKMQKALEAYYQGLNEKE